MSLEQIEQRRVSARGAARPDTVAPRSVFDIAPKPAPFDFARVKVESDVPVPKRGRQPSPCRALLESLEVGQSVALPAELRARVRSTITNIRSDHPDRRYARRLAGEVERVWRVA